MDSFVPKYVVFYQDLNIIYHFGAIMSPKIDVRAKGGSSCVRLNNMGSSNKSAPYNLHN